jgi:hypothetical protein
MKKLWLLTAGLVVFSGCIFADSIWSGSSGSSIGIPATASITPPPTYTGLPISTQNQAPFWNNPSGDTANLGGHLANIGGVLEGVATQSNLIGSNLSGGIGGNVLGTYFSFAAGDAATGGGDPAGVTPNNVTTETPSLEFSFMSTATAFNVAVLFADSGLDGGTGNAGGPGTVFGYYYGSGAGIQLHQLGGTVNNNFTGTSPQSLATAATLDGAGAVYGLYATVCYVYSGTTCTGSVTYTTGAGNFSTNIAAGSQFLGALDWNHFAFFQLTNGEEVLGFEDSPFALGSTFDTEGEGDFNDVVIGLVGNPAVGSSAPEPGTIAIMGLGLAGLGLIGRRRFVKK